MTEADKSNKIGELETHLLSGPQGGEPDVGVYQYQACIGVRDALWLCRAIRELLAVAEEAKAYVAHTSFFGVQATLWERIDTAIAKCKDGTL